MAGSYTQISADNGHACALQSDGRVACWGKDMWGQATVPSGPYTRLSSGYDYDLSCALKSDGSIYCWGQSLEGQPACVRDDDGGIFCLTSSKGVYTDVSRGIFRDLYYLCAVDEESNLYCVGQDPHYADAVIPAGSYLQVSVGTGQTCAVKSDTGIACWGTYFFNNGSGSDGPAVSPPGSSYRQVSTGYNAACALKDDGTIFCWGNEAYQDVGLDLRNFFNSVPLGSFTQVRVAQTLEAGGFACALQTNGNIACWGTYRNEQGEEVPFTFPRGSYTALAVGSYYSVWALRSDGVIVYPEGLSHRYAQADFPAGLYQALSPDGWGAITEDGSIVTWGVGAVILPARL